MENISESFCIRRNKRDFHRKYLSVCTKKNLAPVTEIVKFKNDSSALNFHCERLTACDWRPICQALSKDSSLEFLKVSVRKQNGLIIDDADTYEKAKALTNAPAIYSKFTFTKFIESLQSLMDHNVVLEKLILEGLPLHKTSHMTSLVAGLEKNRSLKFISFARSKIGDDNCEIFCQRMKNFMNIEILNMSDCNLGLRGATAVKDFVSAHRIERTASSWTKSLRYRDIDFCDHGLRRLILNNNPAIGDNGLELIVGELIEDNFVKEVEMKNCGLSHNSAKLLAACLEYNETLSQFDISQNNEISDSMVHQIDLHFYTAKANKVEPSKEELLERICELEKRLGFQTESRIKAEEMCSKLTVIVEAMNEVFEDRKACSIRVPKGFAIVRSSVINEILREKTLELVKLNVREHKRQMIKHSKLNMLNNALKEKRKELRLFSRSSDMSEFSAPVELEAATIKNSESRLGSSSTICEDKCKLILPYVESRIGDYFHNKQADE